MINIPTYNRFGLLSPENEKSVVEDLEDEEEAENNVNDEIDNKNSESELNESCKSDSQDPNISTDEITMPTNYEDYLTYRYCVDCDNDLLRCFGCFENAKRSKKRPEKPRYR